LQNRQSAIWATPPVHFAVVNFEMGSCEIFAWTGFAMIILISASQVAKITSMSCLNLVCISSFEKFSSLAYFLNQIILSLVLLLNF
jgi:hypothetical protein